MKQASLLASLATVATQGARFASFTYTAKGTGEVARHTVALGVNVERAYRRDLRILEGQRIRIANIGANKGNGATVEIAGKEIDADLALCACDELIASLRESLEKGIGNNSAYTNAETYTPICPGVKVHKESGALQVFGFSMAKKVLTPAESKKVVKSSGKTIAKNQLRKLMKTGKFRQFAFEGVNEAKVNGKTLSFE